VKAGLVEELVEAIVDFEGDVGGAGTETGIQLKTEALVKVGLVEVQVMVCFEIVQEWVDFGFVVLLIVVVAAAVVVVMVMLIDVVVVVVEE